MTADLLIHNVGRYYMALVALALLFVYGGWELRAWYTRRLGELWLKKFFTSEDVDPDLDWVNGE